MSLVQQGSQTARKRRGKSQGRRGSQREGEA
jgi:hypothetical protein